VIYIFCFSDNHGWIVPSAGNWQKIDGNGPKVMLLQLLQQINLQQKC